MISHGGGESAKIEFNDFVKPIDRKIIFQKLSELQSQKDLSEIEQKEYFFTCMISLESDHGVVVNFEPTGIF